MHSTKKSIMREGGREGEREGGGQGGREGVQREREGERGRGRVCAHLLKSCHTND